MDIYTVTLWILLIVGFIVWFCLLISFHKDKQEYIRLIQQIRIKKQIKKVVDE